MPVIFQKEDSLSHKQRHGQIHLIISVFSSHHVYIKVLDVFLDQTTLFVKPPISHKVVLIGIDLKWYIQD